MKLLHNVLGILCGFALMIILLITSIEAVTYWTPGYYEKEYAKYGVLNDVLVDAQAINPTTTFNGGRLKIFYANQVSICPPTFVLFVNDPQYMHFSYKRYLENRLRDSFGFEGTPIHIICRKRD